MSERAPREFDKAECECYLCRFVMICTYVKAAHIPLYAWVCPECYDNWTDE
jgi:hypothetical protein